MSVTILPTSSKKDYSLTVNLHLYDTPVVGKTNSQQYYMHRDRRYIIYMYMCERYIRGVICYHGQRRLKSKNHIVVDNIIVDKEFPGRENVHAFWAVVTFTHIINLPAGNDDKNPMAFFSRCR